MGIKGLYKLIKEKGAFVETHISVFSNMLIPIDISTYLYRYKCTQGNEWTKLMTQFLSSFVESKTRPVVIIDGPSSKLKEEEKKRRVDEKKKKENNISKMKKDFHEGKITEGVEEKIIKKRGLLYTRGKSRSHEKKKSPVSLEDFESYIEKQENQNVTITDDDIKILINLCNDLGVEYLKSPCEAETLAAKFVEQGLTKVIASEDSDCFAYRGSRFVISNIDVFGNCKLISFQDVLKVVGVADEKQFRDFCILSGTDYGKYKGIAGKTANKIILKYKCIEEYEKIVGNNSVDYKGIRNIFYNFDGIKNDILDNFL